MNDQKWWTKLAASSKAGDVWMVFGSSSLYHSNCDGCTQEYGVHPVITIS